MGNGVLALNLLECVEVVGVGAGVQFEDLVIDVASELTLNDISQDLAFRLVLGLDRDAGQDLLVEAVDLAYLQG